MKAVRKILVPTDLSDHSLVAIEYAKNVARLFHASVHILHVVEDLDSFVADKCKEVTMFLALRLSDMSNCYTLVRRGEPEREIIRVASEGKFDLIIMATHGKTGFAHVLLGTVAERVVERSPIPVLTVNPFTMEEPLLTDEDIKEQLHIH